jgi:hypothetical protein
MRMSTVPSHEYDPAWVPPGDAAGEEPQHALALSADASAPEWRGRTPEAGGSPDIGGIHWNEQSELGIADTRARADEEDRELPGATDVGD